MLVAEGAVDLAAEPALALHDMAALDVIVREAGGLFTSLDGIPGPLGGNALASNGRLHDQALAFLGSLADDENDPDVAPHRAGSVHDLSARRRPAQPSAEHRDPE
jgi:histidinol-phosphatase